MFEIEITLNIYNIFYTQKLLQRCFEFFGIR